MSFLATAWAWKQRLPPGPKLVLLALSDYANPDSGLCIPSQSKIAARVGMDTRTVRRHLDVLEQQEFIRREHRQRSDGSRMSDSYLLMAPEIQQGATPAREGLMPAGGEGVLPYHESLRSLNQQDNRREDLSLDSPSENLRERNIAPSKSKKKKSEEDPIFEQAWSMYRKRDHDSKTRGRQAWRRSLEAAGRDPAPLLAGIRRYMAYCEGTETKFIKGFAVFFGPDEFWRQQWTPESRQRDVNFTDSRADAADRILAAERERQQRADAREREKIRIHDETGVDVDDPGAAQHPATLEFRRLFPRG